MEKEKKKKVDEGWKEKVAEEKDKVKKETEKKKEEAEAPLPEANFNMFVSSLAAQVMIQLGDIENPLTKKKEKNLEQAKYTIDTIQMLEEKTKGNLTEDETKFLKDILYDLRMRYVKVSE